MSELTKTEPFGFSEVEYISAEKILEEIASDGSEKNDEISPYLEGTDLDSQYNGSYVAHPRFRKCNFNGTKFIGINGIASNILDCRFKEVEFRDCGMAFSDFSETHFTENTVLNNCGCTDCSFLDADFRDVCSEGSVFDRSFFINAEFENVTFRHCSFEDALFQNACLKSCDLIHANLEYASFRNTTVEAVNFPFWGILRAFGGIQMLQKFPDSTIQYTDGAKKLEAKRFLNLLPDLQAYFFKRGDYFILANINIFMGNQTDALYYIMVGLKHSLEQRDFRMIRYLCRFASVNHFFTSKELQLLYQALVANSQISLMNDHQYQLYLREITEIKQLLIDNPFSRPQMVITYSTDLDPQDYDGLANFLRFFESMVQRELPQCSYYYSVRHNSPLAIEYFLSDILPNLYHFISVIHLSLWGTTQGFAAFQKLLDLRSKRISNAYDKKTLEARVRHEELKNELLEEQIYNQKLINKKLEQEIRASEEKKQIFLTDEHISIEDLGKRVKTINFTIQSVDPTVVPLRNYTFTVS